jgi:tRNA-uridine aminocarboxypropyltransferase
LQIPLKLRYPAKKVPHANTSSNKETWREVCYRCFKPKIVCICKQILKIDNLTEFLILQHKNERRHAIGTARIATLGLKNIKLQIAWPNRRDKFTAGFDSFKNAGLLYPSEHARDLAQVAQADKPEKLVILDGTWSQARKLYRDNPWLHGLPHYRLTPASPSNYRIRKEPNAQATSTVEAIVQAMKILEPQTSGIDNLLDVFNSMIDRQIDYLTNPARLEPNGRQRRKRNRESRSIPEEFKIPLDRIVVAYGESVSQSNHSRVLVSWVALRLGSEEHFEEFVTPPDDAHFSDNHLALMELDSSHFESALGHTGFKEKWNEFARPGDLLVTWNKNMLDLFLDLAGNQNSFFLKAVYANIAQRKFGHLKDIVNQEKLRPPKLKYHGRAARVLADAVAVTNYMHNYSLAIT